jgi:EAL domain-containing protein (putative c-di-GMP-specific phosphodiesterase class I)/GGDEF domain-containing protein
LKAVDAALPANSNSGAHPTVIEFGIRGLPRITGVMGRHVGDYVISALAARLAALAEADWIVARIDYFSFAVFVPNVVESVDALMVAKRVIDDLSQPIDWPDRTLNVSLHAGVTLGNNEIADATTLLHQAEITLKAAGEKGGPGYAFYNPDIEKALHRKQELLTALNDALAHGYFSLNFQPYFHSATGELHGFEALLRLKHPTLGNLSPAEFIPVAEENDLICRMGVWILDEACRVASTWPGHLSVSVNFSPEQFLDGALISHIHNALEKYRFPAYRLEIEITESTMLEDSEVVSQQVTALRELGCFIVLDDFGTGYSSLNYLWKYPFSKLKIDRSFVMAMEGNAKVRGILRSIVDLAKNLGLKITAEGIETPAQAEMLRKHQCDYIQGYLSGRPVPEQDVAAIILKRFADSLKPIEAAPEAPAQPSQHFKF